VRTDAATAPDLLRLRVRQDAARPAVVTYERTITYGELDAVSARVAGRLARAGAAKGSRIGLLMENGVDWVCAAVAVIRMGAVLVPLSTFLRPPELEWQLRTAAVSHLIVTDGFNGRDYLADVATLAPGLGADGACDPALPSLRRVWPVSELLAAEGTAEVSTLVAELEKDVTPADDMVVMFTSGSSGAPKGCIHTHASTIIGVSTSLADRGVRGDDRLYLPMPLFWTGGFGMGLMTALITGCALMTEAMPEPSRTLRFIAGQKVTLFRGWPDQAVRIARCPEFAEADLTSLRAGSLDALLPPPLKAKAANARAGLLGMTETFGPYCCYPLDRDMPQDKWGASGLVQPHVEVQIRDPESGLPLLRGEAGAIWIRGPNLMRGICGREARDVFDSDGFYDTGDLGLVDDDGFLFYRGRGDDMFKARGASVYPSEVERALQALPAVSRAFVTDVKAAGSGEPEVGAAIVPVEGARLDADQLSAALKDSLSAFKRPTRWLIISSIEDVPMLSSGKVDKRALRDALAGAGR
jgi:acyl-CoA synthetase (AMP-forming)/AMP-acid ligase II